MRYGWLWIFVSFSFSALNASAQDAESFIEYTVKKGDTCTGIAKEVYGSGQLCYKMISKYNKMSKKFVIIPGQTLRLPSRQELGVKDPDPDAILSAKKGQVQARSPSTESWKDAARGASLWKLWRVNSGEKSSAEVSFTRIKGRLEMRENTLVIIYGPQNSKTQTSTSSRASLERGTLRSRLGELSGADKPELIVETPAAQATINAQGQTIFDVEQNGTTRVANLDSKGVSLEGRDAPSASPKKKPRKRKRFVLPENTGSKVEPGKDPTPPKPLPAAPTWKSKGPMRILTLGGKNAATIVWAPQADAAQYRVELANKPDGTEVLDSFKLQSSFNQVVLENLPVQSYWARVSTIDADRFEGRPSGSLELVVTKVDPKPPQGLRVAKADAGVVYVGSRFEIPGLRCRLDEAQAPAASLELTQAGPQTLSCVDDKDNASTLNVQVEPIKVSGLEKPLNLKPGEQATLTFKTEPATDALTISPPQGVTLISQTQRPDGSWELVLAAAPDAPAGAQQLKLSLPQSSTQGQQELTLAQAPIEVGQSLRTEPSPSTPTRAPFMRLGVFGQGSALYNEPLELDGEALGLGLGLGLRADLLLSSQAWVGFDAGLGQTGFELQARRAQHFNFSLYGAWQITQTSLAPFLRFGVGGNILRYNTGYDNTTRGFDAGARQTRALFPIEAGLGLRLALGEYMSVRADFVEHLDPWSEQGLGLYSSAMLGLSVTY